MIGADTVMEVVPPIGEAVQVDIEILKETAGVVLPFDGHSETAAHAGIDAVGGDEIATPDKLFLFAPIRMRDPRRDAIRLQRQVMKCRVVLDRLSKMGARVIAHERFGLALVVRKDAVVARIHGGVIEAGTHFRPLTITNKVHDVSFAPEVAVKDTL